MSLAKRRLAAAGIASLALASASFLAHCDVEGVTPNCTTDGSQCVTAPGVPDPGAGGASGAGGEAGEGGSGGAGGTNAGGAGAGGGGGSGNAGTAGNAGAAGSADAGLRDVGASDADAGNTDAASDRRTDGDVGNAIEAGSLLDVRLDAPDSGEP